jgi:hypothetical protein
VVEPASRSAAMDLRTAHEKSTSEMGTHEMSGRQKYPAIRRFYALEHSTFETGWTARQVLGAHPKNNTVGRLLHSFQDQLIGRWQRTPNTPKLYCSE